MSAALLTANLLAGGYPEATKPSVKADFEGSVKSDVSTAASTEGSPYWTKSTVLSLCEELLEGFNAPAFQQQLADLCANAPDSRVVTGRMELALTVQREVLPKYGFPGTVEGVEAMRETIIPFMIDWMVKKIVDEIDKSLGLPQNSTAKACLGPCGDAPTEDEVPGQEKVPGVPLAPSRLRSESMSISDSKLHTQRQVRDIPALTKGQVLELIGDLLQTVSDPGFQIQLQELPKDDESRRELVLKAQRQVLPKHGFPGTRFGSILMFDAIAPFIDDFLVSYLASQMDEKIGWPKGATANMCKGTDISNTPSQAKLTEAPTSPAARLTRGQVLSLCSELLEGFLASNFQDALQAILKRGNKHAVGPERSLLALTVQSEVLPKYGLPGTTPGVLRMLDEVAPYASDWLVASLVNDIDEALGLRVGTTLSSFR